MSSRQHHRGFTFVELIAAIAVLAITIVPATQYMADSMTLRRRLERERVMVILAIQQIEQQMAVINGGFTTAQETGRFTPQGHPKIAYERIRTDATTQGGIPGLLMGITVRVWSDGNGNLVRDAGEPMVELHTKMARSIECRLRHGAQIHSNLRPERGLRAGCAHARGSTGPRAGLGR